MIARTFIHATSMKWKDIFKRRFFLDMKGDNCYMLIMKIRSPEQKSLRLLSPEN